MIMPRTSDERSQQARLAALARVAREPSGAAMTQRARDTYSESWYLATDPALPEAERRRQADAAKRAHYTRLSLRAARARRVAREAAGAAVAAEADELAARRGRAV